MQIQQPSQFHCGHVGKCPPPVINTLYVVLYMYICMNLIGSQKLISIIRLLVKPLRLMYSIRIVSYVTI